MQGNIARWLKKEGDKVSPGEVLCEVETVSPVELDLFKFTENNTILSVFLITKHQLMS